MTAPLKRVHPALALAAALQDEDLPLAALSARAGLSPFHLHRMFSAVAGETPKQYTLRLRVSRGAALLLTSDQSVLDEALDDVARTPTSIEVDVVEDTLPGGPAATTVHAGSYETLSDAYGAVEAWMQSHGLPSAGAPWESYITDPTEHPDPRDWKTEVCWPVR